MLSADDKLGMSLDDIIKRSRRGNNRSDNRRGRRFGNRQGKRSYRVRASNAQLQARANAKPNPIRLLNRQRLQQRISRPNAAAQLSLTTPGFRARQRRQQALIALAKRLTRRKIVQLAASRRPRRLQAQPVIMQAASRRLALIRANRRRRLQRRQGVLAAAKQISDRQFDELLESSRSFRNSSEGERRFLSRQLADVAADRRRRRTVQRMQPLYSSNSVPETFRLPNRTFKKVASRYRATRQIVQIRENRRGLTFAKRSQRRFDDGRSVLRRPSRSNNRRIQEARRYDRFYSDEDSIEDEYLTMGSLYADEIAPRRERRFPKLRRQVIINSPVGSRRRMYY